MKTLVLLFIGVTSTSPSEICQGDLTTKNILWRMRWKTVKVTFSLFAAFCMSLCTALYHNNSHLKFKFQAPFYETINTPKIMN
jgi:hypothetical protein